MSPTVKREHPPDRPASGWARFYRVVRKVPRGRVITYGGVARLAGQPNAARQVGYAMAALEEGRGNEDVPWHRVLGADGAGYARISIRDPMGEQVQRALLEQEGVTFDARGRVSLARFGWTGRATSRPRSAGPSGPRSPRRVEHARVQGRSRA